MCNFPDDFVARNPGYKVCKCDKTCYFCTLFPDMADTFIHVLPKSKREMQYILIKKDNNSWTVIGRRDGPMPNVYTIYDIYERGIHDTKQWFRNRQLSDHVWRGNIKTGQAEWHINGRWVPA